MKKIDTLIKLEKLKVENQKLKKVLKITATCIFTFVSIIIISILLISVRSKATGKIPTFAGYQIYSVLGGSMEPNINKGSVVILKRPNLELLKVDDVIAFISSSDKKTIVTHRIVKVNREEKVSFTTRGDANDVNDINQVQTDNIIGKVTTHIPFVGYFMNFAKQKIGILILIIIPGVLIILLELLNLKKSFKSLKKQKNEAVSAKTDESLISVSAEGGNSQM